VRIHAPLEQKKLPHISESRVNRGNANSAVAPHPKSSVDKLLTTKEVATTTGLSTSYFEKGRIYGYGPKFLRLRSNSKSGAVRYRPDDLMNWLLEGQGAPEVGSHD
jgi:hypothetical protein